MREADHNQIDWIELGKLLDHWFERGFTRRCTLPYDSKVTQMHTALLAASLYKRGGDSLLDVNTGELTQLKHLHAPDTQSEKTSISLHSTLDSFFRNFDEIKSGALAICDSAVIGAHPALLKKLKEHEIEFFIFHASEQSKNLISVQQILQSMKTTPTKVVVIGGGVCCDVGGLAGSLLNARVHLVPTTLLSAADAGIGGKTGVNHPKAGKNQIGRFIQLASVSIITELFRTLSASQIRQGVAEMAKHSYLAGSFYEWRSTLEELISAGPAFPFNQLKFTDLIEHNIQFKSSVVKLDPFDQSLRNMLNFGHTTAHLIEAIQSFDKEVNSPTRNTTSISHGIAVAIGMYALAESGLIAPEPPEFFQLLSRLLEVEKVTLPFICNLPSHDAAGQLLLHDKKKTNKEKDSVRLIAPRYGSMRYPERIEDPLQFMNENTLELGAGEFIRLLLSSGVIK